MHIKNNCLIKIIPVLALIGAAYWLLGSDFFTFMTWWELLVLLGILFMPVTSAIFQGFDENGWMFSKVLAVACCGYLQWLLSSLKIIPFTGIMCVFVTILCCTGSILYGIRSRKGLSESIPWKQTAIVYREEILFFAVFLFSFLL